MITSENAKELQLKSAQAKQAKKLAEASEPLEFILTVESQGIAEASKAYDSTRLLRIRKQLDILEKRIQDELDNGAEGKELNQLAQAHARLSATEQCLAMRPSPGSLKPTSKPDKRQRSTSPEPIPENPAPPPAIDLRNMPENG